METSALHHSPLESVHLAHGARLVPFAGWLMPVQYSGITDEHLAVRRHAGVFDISHMGEFFVSGPGATSWLNRLLTNDVGRLEVGGGQYTLMLNDRGGVIDDLIVYRTDPAQYFLVVNAAKIDEDRAWMQAHLPDDGSVVFENQSAEWAAMAVQGPAASSLLDHLPPRNGVKVGGSVIMCRTGYTGEDGFELFAPLEAGGAWFERFVAAGAKPCGLGARDTLRLEMCFPLNGSDLAPDRTPLEAGLASFVALDKGDFIGRSVLLSQKTAGNHDRLVALRLVDKGPPLRSHYPVALPDGTRIGELTSGGISPSLGFGIGLAYLPSAHAKAGTRLAVDIRGRLHPAEVVKKPFYRKPPEPSSHS
ncbi:MAG: glycine cleavage system aminomethyltransferase GcvT [Verrucomicrobiales bacterium]